MKMLALSVRPPWSWLIVKGYKPVENRTWNTKIRGEILIHQAKTFDWDALEFLRDFFPQHLKEVVEEFGITPSKKWYVKPDKIGGIIGKTVIVDCVTEFDSPWFFGPNGFVLKDSQELPFMRVPGQLNFFEVDYNEEDSE